jgi:uncharacterized protein (DUF1800 family)
MNQQITTKSIIAVNRFGLGARPGELERINKDPASWLLEQLQGPPQPAADIGSLPDSASIVVEIQQAREQRQKAKKAGKTSSKDTNQVGRTLRRHYMQQTSARFRSAATTDHPFYERLVHFWSNHFAVSTDKPPIPALAGAYENEVIRPNLSGKFLDLLTARSMGPGSQAARRMGRRKPESSVGLNENLAREILELHTLGVDGGYTQEDVTSFARALTGWSIGGGRRQQNAGTPGKFHFRNELHEPGSVTILGKRYAQKGQDQGNGVLADLAVHPSTAKHIAFKLARHFVADEPPAGLVDKLASAFLKSGGDLPTLHAALVNAAEPWESAFAKYKTPDDFVVSTFRAFKHVPDDFRKTFAALENMGQVPYKPGSPAGWPDTAQQWGGADGLYKRIEWANAVARVAGKRVNPLELGEAVLGPALGDHTRTAISRAESLEQGLTLLLVSPEFQRR